MTTAKSTRPVPEIDIFKNDYTIIRVCRREYQGKHFIDIRTYCKDDAGEFRPTKKGVTILPGKLDSLIDALKRI